MEFSLEIDEEIEALLNETDEELSGSLSDPLSDEDDVLLDDNFHLDSSNGEFENNLGQLGPVPCVQEEEPTTAQDPPKVAQDLPTMAQDPLAITPDPEEATQDPDAPTVVGTARDLLVKTPLVRDFDFPEDSTDKKPAKIIKLSSTGRYDHVKPLRTELKSKHRRPVVSPWTKTTPHHVVIHEPFEDEAPPTNTEPSKVAITNIRKFHGFKCLPRSELRSVLPSGGNRRDVTVDANKEASSLFGKSRRTVNFNISRSAFSLHHLQTQNASLPTGSGQFNLQTEFSLQTGSNKFSLGHLR